MNRIETKIIIMITNRLADAKESNAKTEMIEELSENLYQRYLDLAAEGIPEEEALSRAMESLGDVEELLAYLKEEELEENARGEYQEKEESREEKSSSSFKDDLENGIEEIVKAAFSTAKVAVDCAWDVAKEVSDQIKEKYPDGVFTGFSPKRGKKVDCTAIPSEYVNSLEIRLTNGSIEITCTDEEDSFIEISGDTEEIETMLKEDGVLSISQGNTASAAYFFMRGMRRSDIKVRLPKKLWDRIWVSTVNGDIQLCGEPDGELHGETKSGDIEVEGRYGRCELFSVSGDVDFKGESREINCSSTSGDVHLHLVRLPEKARGNSISGDCEIKISPEEGFHISYRTVSGKFMTNLPLAGTLGEKQGNAVYGETVCGELQLSTVSGDIEVCGIE